MAESKIVWILRHDVYCDSTTITPLQNLHPAIPDVPIPSKFLFLLLTPSQNYDEECKTIGRTMGAILADEVGLSLFEKGSQ